MKRFVKPAALCMILAMVAVLLCAPVGALGTTSAKEIVGHGAVGEGSGKQTTVVDFANSDLDGFASFSGSETLNIGASAVWGTNVLKTHLASLDGVAGIQKSFTDASVFTGASTLSVQMVAQTTAYTVTLRLSGTDKNGTPVIWEASTAVSTNHWQTVTFDIAAFTAQMNTDAPITLALLASATTQEGTGADWMIKSLYVSTPQIIPDYVLPLASAVCGFVVGFSIFFMIYRTTCKKNRRSRWEER